MAGLVVPDRHTDRQTHTRTHRPSTVTLAHVRRGLMKLIVTYMYIIKVCTLLGERERAHLVVQLARFFYIYIYIYLYIYASSVSPDTVSFLNVSTRFYLGVHAVRNIATTVYGSRSLALALTANTPAFLRKGRYGTTHLSQRRAHGPICL